MTKAYFVLNENTLGFIRSPRYGWFEPLHISILRGATRNRLSGPFPLGQKDVLRPATEDDFDAYRVCLPQTPLVQNTALRATIVQHPVGTRLFFVPIRYWEDRPIETGAVALHKGIEEGEIWPSFTHDGSVYAFHDGYGHNVYMRTKDVFLTKEEVLEEIKIRKASDDAALRAEEEEFMKRIFCDKGPAPEPLEEG